MAFNVHGAAIEMTEEQIDADLLQLSIDQVDRSDQSVIGKLDDKDDRVQRQLAQNHRDFAKKSYVEFSKLDISTIPMAPIDTEGKFKNNKGNYYLDLSAPSKAVFIPTVFGKDYINLVALQHNVKAFQIEAAADKLLISQGKPLPVAKSATSPLTNAYISRVTHDTYWPNSEVIPFSPSRNVQSVQQHSGYAWAGFITTELGEASSIIANVCGLPAIPFYSVPFTGGITRAGYAYTNCANNKTIYIKYFNGLSYTGASFEYTVTIK